MNSEDKPDEEPQPPKPAPAKPPGDQPVQPPQGGLIIDISAPSAEPPPTNGSGEKH